MKEETIHPAMAAVVAIALLQMEVELATIVNEKCHLEKICVTEEKAVVQ
jgi:hypothetical protein